MDGVSVAASLVGIGVAGSQIAIKLYTLATQISTASERITSISNDVSLTSGVLQELGEFMTRETANNDTSIFNRSGLETTKQSAAMCDNIFKQIEQAARDASQQLRTKNKFVGKIKLSRSEKAKWPFLQPNIESLRVDLREAKGTLMLMLQVMNLALSRKMAAVHEAAPMGVAEQREIYRAILAIQKQVQDKDSIHSEVDSEETPDNGTPKPTSLRVLDRRLSFDELSTAKQPSLAPSDLDPPLTPDVFMATSEPDKPDTRSPQEMKDEAINVDGSSSSKDCSTGIEQGNLNSNLEQSPPTGKTPALNVIDIEDHREDLKKLILFLVRPHIWDGGENRIVLSWYNVEPRVSQADVENQLSKDEEQGLPSILEVYADLSVYEEASISQNIAKSGPYTSLVSLKRTHVDKTYHGILFKGIPSLQYVLMTNLNGAKKGALETEARLNEEKIRSEIIDSKQKWKKDESMVLNLDRPTYIKAHRKWLDPETLIAYDLPWEWDDNHEYIIIKCWVNQHDQDKLFEHTRRLRNIGTVELKRDETRRQPSILMGQPKPTHPDALYGSLPGLSFGALRAMRSRRRDASPLRPIDFSDEDRYDWSDGDESDESDEEAISNEEEAARAVEELLGKYTTLFQQPQHAEEGQHVEQASTAAGADDSQESSQCWLFT
ncbi:MAG: hypothetical protein Q9178_004458 [Gyalolechia marmorata]